MSNIKSWSKTPASNNSASPNGAPEGMAPSAVNDIMRQQMADHRTQWEDAEWFDWGHVPTRTGNTTFTIPTDLTAVYIANRRLKCSDATTIYASVLSSSFTAVTTVTVSGQSGSLSASLTAVAVGVLSGLDSIPGAVSIPQNSQSAAYTTVISDAGKHILHPTADNNARTFTIDSNANVPYAVGTVLTFVNQINTVTIAITSDTLTLAGAGTTGSRSLAASGIATALKVSSTGWIISGTGLS